MARPIYTRTDKERKELQDEVLNVLADFINGGGNEEFPFQEKIEEIRIKHDIHELDMSLYMSAYLTQVIEFLESRGK